MSAWPDDTIIFLDVDARVVAPLDDLAAIDCDVGIHFKAERRKRLDWLPPRLRGWSGTLLLQPTRRAEDFVHEWWEASQMQAGWDVDQTSMMVALGRVPGLRVGCLSGRWLSSPDHRFPGAAIEHDSAGDAARRQAPFRRAARVLWT